MIHFVLHDPRDTVAVVVVEGVKAGAELTGWIMDDDRMVDLVQSPGFLPAAFALAFVAASRSLSISSFFVISFSM